jgi:hypothetical protein
MMAAIVALVKTPQKGSIEVIKIFLITTAIIAVTVATIN